MMESCVMGKEICNRNNGLHTLAAINIKQSIENLRITWIIKASKQKKKMSQIWHHVSSASQVT